jgi:hypothetical protein
VGAHGRIAQLIVRLTPAELQALRDAAAADGTSMCGVVRNSLNAAGVEAISTEVKKLPSRV